MDFEFRQGEKKDIHKAFNLLKSAAKILQKKNINQWHFWLNPTQEKINWINEGFSKKEFFFIQSKNQIIGMFRISNQDILYWGIQNDEARYIHSFVIDHKFSGNQLGKKVLDKIILDLKTNKIFILRLDCNASNLNLCAYYENQGFVKVGEKQMPHALNNLYEKRL